MCQLDVPFKPGDHGSACPIDFAGYDADQGFYQLEVNIGPTSWLNRIVGLMPSGLICINRRTSKWGYYINHVAPVHWNEIREVRFSRKSSPWLLFLGIVAIIFGLAMGGALIFVLFDGVNWGVKQCSACSA